MGRHRRAEPSARVAIVSDTHGEVDARVVDAAAGCDYVVHAGDVGSRAVLDALTPANGTLVAVRGNNDVPEKWHRSEWACLESLPWEARLSLPGGELAVVHGHRYGTPGRHHDRMRRDYADARLVVYGHSHHKCADRDATPWVVNPGAAGRVRTYGGPAICLLEASMHEWRLAITQFPPVERRRKALADRLD